MNYHCACSPSRALIHHAIGAVVGESLSEIECCQSTALERDHSIFGQMCRSLGGVSNSQIKLPYRIAHLSSHLPIQDCESHKQEMIDPLSEMLLTSCDQTPIGLQFHYTALIDQSSANRCRLASRSVVKHRAGQTL